MAKVVARDGEDFEALLERFNAAVLETHHRRWYKRRFGYHEKPSLLNKKRRRHRKVNGGKRVWLRIGLAALYRRDGPDDAMGR